MVTKEYIVVFHQDERGCGTHWEEVKELVRCKDCKHRRVNEHYGKKGYLDLKAMCDLDTGDVFELGRNAEIDDWYCADGERKDGNDG